MAWPYELLLSYKPAFWRQCVSMISIMAMETTNSPKHYFNLAMSQLIAPWDFTYCKHF